MRKGLKEFVKLPKWIQDDYIELAANSFVDRKNLEWIVYHALFCEDPIITHSRACELLGFEYMEDLRKWIKKKKEAKDAY